MDVSVLEGLGLTHGEVMAYITLLEVGQTKVGTIIEKSGLASSAVHNCLNTLTEKGLITYIKKGKIKFYRAVPPQHLLDFIEDKKQKLAHLLPELELRLQRSGEKEEAEIFEGTKGVLTLLNVLLENVHKGDEYLFFATNVREHNEEIKEFFTPYDVKRKVKGLIIKGLASPTQKPIFKDRKLLDMRYPAFPIPSNLSICNTKVAIFSWDKQPIGYLIRSKQISAMYRDYFNAVWNGSRIN